MQPTPSRQEHFAEKIGKGKLDHRDVIPANVGTYTSVTVEFESSKNKKRRESTDMLVIMGNLLWSGNEQWWLKAPSIARRNENLPLLLCSTLLQRTNVL